MGAEAENVDRLHRLQPLKWWHKLRPLHWLFSLLVLVGALHGLEIMGLVKLPGGGITGLLGRGPHPETEHYLGREDGVEFLPGIRSYSSMRSAEQVLNRNGYTDRVLERSHSSVSPDYPPYDFDAFVVAGYRHLGESGVLTLRFFNDRLFQAEFVPGKPQLYVRRMGVLRLRRDRNARAERVDGNLRIASTVGLAVSKVGQHLKSEPYVIWQDLRLIRQRDEWDLRFGSIPRPMAER